MSDDQPSGTPWAPVVTPVRAFVLPAGARSSEGRPQVPFGPVAPNVLQRHWPAPGSAPSVGVLAGAAGVGVLAASTLLVTRPGLQTGLIGTAAGLVALLAARRSAAPASRWRTAFGVLAVALSWVPALRDSAPSRVLSILAALGLAALAAVDGRSWRAVVLAGPASAVASVRGVLWAATRAHHARRPRGLGPWLRGAALGVVAVWLFGVLLSSADSAFAAVVDTVVPTVDLGTLPGRVVIGVVFAVGALTLAFSAASPPDWDAVPLPRRRDRPAVEWALPLGLVDALLAAFVAVQAAVLFAENPDALLGTGTTPAERAREGFGQLVAVTVLAVVLLAWAGRRAGTDRGRRRLLAVLGGGLVALVLVVVASALRRMALYESFYGWTVLRINVAVFEVWLAVVLVLCALAWATRRTAVIAPGVVLAAAVGLLGLNVASPDALAAAANVDRFASTGKVDTDYLARLSDDAVPAIRRLPEPQRSDVLAFRYARHDPWYSVSLSRLRAAQMLPDDPRETAQVGGQ